MKYSVRGAQLRLFSQFLSALALALTSATASAQASFTELHSLERTALDQSLYSADPVTRLRANLVAARRAGELDFDTGATVFTNFLGSIDRTQNPSEWNYASIALAELHMRLGKLDDALARLEENPPPDALGMDPAVAIFHELVFATLQFYQGDPNVGVQRFRSAGERAQEAGDAVLALQALNGVGLSYMRMGLTREAIDAMATARRSIDAVPSDSTLPIILKMNLAYLYEKAGEHQRAIDGYEEGIEWAIENNQWTRVYIMAAGLGEALVAIGKPEEAISRITAITEKEDISVGIETAVGGLMVLATAYLMTDQFELAEQTIQKARGIVDEENDPVRGAELDVVEARLLAATGQAQAAASKLDQVLAELSQRLPSALHQETLETAADVQVQLGNFFEALELNKQAVAIERANRSAQHDALLGALRVDNDFALKQREVDLLEEKNMANEARKERDLAINGLVLLVGLAALLGTYLTYSRWSNERRARETLEQEVRKRTAQVQFELQGRMDAERDKARLEQRVAEDEKLRAIAQLTGGLSHDFNNIMTVISCSAELIRVRHADANDEDTRELVDDILAATESGAKVTSALLAYARQQPLRPQLTRLDRFFDTHYSLFRNTLGEDIGLSIDAEPAVVEIDQNLLTTSILNLLFNSKDALEQGGQVAISVRTHNDDTGSERVVIRITDNGIGMEEATRTRAMEPFFTTKASGKGSGLGLSMVYGFARQSDATLSIESEPGTGTTVSLNLAGHDGETVFDAPVAESRTGDRPKHRARVLLVEDQEAIRRLAARALSVDSIDVTVCQDAQSAIDILNSSPVFDVVVTDIVMPGVYDGHDVARCARRVSPHTEVLMTSGHADRVPVDFDFLAKPYSVARLVAAVDALLEHDHPKPTLN